MDDDHVCCESPLILLVVINSVLASLWHDGCIVKVVVNVQFVKIGNVALQWEAKNLI